MILKTNSTGPERGAELTPSFPATSNCTATTVSYITAVSQRTPFCAGCSVRRSCVLMELIIRLQGFDSHRVTTKILPPEAVDGSAGFRFDGHLNKSVLLGLTRLFVDDDQHVLDRSERRKQFFKIFFRGVSRKVSDVYLHEGFLVSNYQDVLNQLASAKYGRVSSTVSAISCSVRGLKSRAMATSSSSSVIVEIPTITVLTGRVRTYRMAVSIRVIPPSLKSRPRAGTFIPMIPIFFSTAVGRRFSINERRCLS